MCGRPTTTTTSVTATVGVVVVGRAATTTHDAAVIKRIDGRSPSASMVATSGRASTFALEKQR